jgi:hypothetical protein
MFVLLLSLNDEIVTGVLVAGATRDFPHPPVLLFLPA